ncbi:glutamate ABC transporter substrate-binding protein [Mycolicibacterium sp.]|uniref:glutamate ABC transporter substrate-binding protein n=1 Tax=Mycolicibacterium sp. TaxID=2320850 RepID=UPI003D119DCA
MKNSHRGATLGAVVMAMSLAACGSGEPASSSSSQTEAGDRTIKVGVKFDQPGLGLKQGADYAGFDIDVANYIADKLGVTPEYVQASVSQRETLIQTGQVDYIVGTYVITDPRKEKVSFAGPYFIAGQDLLVRADDASITGVESLTGKKLCSVKGSTSTDVLLEMNPEINLQEYDSDALCVDALRSGAVDAHTSEDVILAGFAAQPANAGKLRVVGNPFSTEEYGVGLRKGDTELCQQITDALDEFVSSGEWQKSVEKNFGAAGFKPGADNPPTPAPCA